MNSGLKNFRESASLIIAAKHCFRANELPHESNTTNFNILALKRSANTNFFPNFHVFPGGCLDKYDTTADWLKLYEKFGFDQKSFDVFYQSAYKPEILENRSDESLPRVVSMRICAIRETFEETGILICKDSKFHSKGNDFKWATYIESEELQKWQKLVHNDTKKFLELCFSLKIYPNIWVLHEWSNWLTPSIVPRRFDTLFFITIFQNTPPTYPEKNEVEEVQWSAAKEFIEMNQNDKILLPPPQFYELSRLMNFSNIEELVTFSQARAKHGTKRVQPHYMDETPNSVMILPGDDSYPLNETEKSHEILDNKSVHRIYRTGFFKHALVIKNVMPELKHVLPLTMTNSKY